MTCLRKEGAFIEDRGDTNERLSSGMSAPHVPWLSEFVGTTSALFGEATVRRPFHLIHFSVDCVRVGLWSYAHSQK